MVTYFVVTGFGKFAGVDDNPSQALVQALQGYLKERGKGIAGGAQLLVCSVLTVSANYVNAWLQALCEELPQHTTQADEIVLLHFGVDQHCQSDMKLEARGYNQAAFRVPDQAGWMPHGEAIDAADGHELLETDLPVAALAAALRAAGGRAVVSHNAGRFVCNYLLFRSLQRSRARAPRWHSLFVHLPCVGGAAGARQLLELAGVLLDELSGALAQRRAHAQPSAGPPLRGAQTQPPPNGEERANGHAANGPDPEGIAETAHDVERALKQVSEAPGAAHAPKEAPETEKDDGLRRAGPDKGRPARGRGLWVLCSVLLLLLVIRIEFWGGPPARTVQSDGSDRRTEPGAAR